MFFILFLMCNTSLTNLQCGFVRKSVDFLTLPWYNANKLKKPFEPMNHHLRIK